MRETCPEVTGRLLINPWHCFRLNQRASGRFDPLWLSALPRLEGDAWNGDEAEISYRLFQKNQAAIEKPIKITKPRKKVGGRRLAIRADT